MVPEPPLLFFFFGALEPLPELDGDGDGELWTGAEYTGGEVTAGAEVTVGVVEVTVGAGAGDGLAWWRR